MKVLLLGGTGAMGTHLARILKETKADIFVTSRQDIKSENNLHYLKGDAKDLTFLRIVLQSHVWDTIVDFMVYNTETFKERVDLLLSSTKQYILLSSARVYADSKQPIIETSPRLLDVSKDADYLATDEYALTKARQEDILYNSENKNWTIIRPYITYNETRLQLGVLEKEEWLYRALHGKTIVFSSDMMEKKTTLTYGLDVAKGIAKIIGNSGTHGQAIHITGDQSMKWKDVLYIYLAVLEERLGYKPKVLLQDLDKFLEVKNTKYQTCYDRLYNRIFNNAKISQYIDVNSFTKIDDGLKHCLNEFLQDPQFTYINWQAEAVKDRQTKEIAPLKEIIGVKSKIKYLIFRYSLIK